MKHTLYKLSDPEAREIMINNCAFYDRVRGLIKRRCRAPGCDYMVSSLAGEDGFVVPEFGAVCGVCYHMHCALQHPDLRDVFYFRNLHEIWKKENEGPRSGSGHWPR